MAQTAGRTIWEQDDGRQRADEGHISLTVSVALFYADDGLVDSTDLGLIQSAFDTLTGIFNRVGVRTTARNTVGVVCRP